MRQYLAVANWKMNLSPLEAKAYGNELHFEKEIFDRCHVVLCAPYLFLENLFPILEKKNILLGSQDVSRFNPNGAYTGEVSANMLQHVGVRFTIVGHSERREYFLEKGHVLIDKINHITAHNLTPIFCVGEGLETRENNHHYHLIENQLEEVCHAFHSEQVVKWVIAYEPVWAIGTGKTATAKEAEEMHAFIRTYLEKKYGKHTAAMIPILYGGSVKADNAAELFSCPNIDGGLVGGASLKASSFSAIAHALSFAKK